MSILIKPIITEKATTQSELLNAYAFEVSTKANKVEIKKAVASTLHDIPKNLLQSYLWHN